MLNTDIYTSAISSIKLITHTTQQPWNAADSLLLSLMDGFLTTDRAQTIQVFNDSRGAISLSLASAHSTINLFSYQDSATSARAIKDNANINELDVFAHADLADLSQPYDLALVQIPKNMDFFEEQIFSLWQNAHSDSKIICAGMIKHLTPQINAILNRYFEHLDIPHAVKKARAFIAQTPRKKPDTQKLEKIFQYETPEGISLINYSNGFSRRKLDIGCRFLLENMPYLEGDICDLGCGNGALGITANKISNNITSTTFIDDSHMAIAAARVNVQRNLFDETSSNAPKIGFYHSDIFSEVGNDLRFDHILCNPPFHETHRVGIDIAHRMFSDSCKRLKPSGTLWIVANRHLGHRNTLKKHFSCVELMAQNPKFVILKACQQASFF